MMRARHNDPAAPLIISTHSLTTCRLVRAPDRVQLGALADSNPQVSASCDTLRRMIDSTTLLEQALSLPEPERAKIAARLLESLDEQIQDDVDAAWAAEIERRCAAVDDGLLPTNDWSDVRARIEREIFGR